MAEAEAIAPPTALRNGDAPRLPLVGLPLTRSRSFTPYHTHVELAAAQAQAQQAQAMTSGSPVTDAASSSSSSSLAAVNSSSAAIHSNSAAVPAAALAPSTPGSVSRRVVPPSPAACSLRILCADDNAINQKVLLKLLNREGHSVTMVDDGQKAVWQFEQQQESNPFDLILLDICMRQSQHTPGTEVRLAQDVGAGNSTHVVLCVHALAQL